MDIVHVTHESGFFSCCSVILHQLVEFVNKYKRLPILKANSFTIYGGNMNDFFKLPDYDYFKKNLENMKYNINYHHTYQYSPYKKLTMEKNNNKKLAIDNISKNMNVIENNQNLEPSLKYRNDKMVYNSLGIDFHNLQYFLKTYFNPTDEVLMFEKLLIQKYSIDPQNICVLFYRGNDKCSETELCNYGSMIIKAKEILGKDSKLKILIQSDETEFLDNMKNTFPNNVIFYNEIRHIPKNPNSTVDFNSNNIVWYSKQFLAIILLMSKCKHVITNHSGNCTIWISMYRGNSYNFHQWNLGEFI